MKIILSYLFFALTLIGCDSAPKITPGPFCSSSSAYLCHESGISYGTDAMQECIKDIEKRCSTESKIPAPPTEFEKCMADVNSNSFICNLGCLGSKLSCSQLCDDRKIAQTDRCEARQKGIPHQYRPPAQPQKIIIQQQQPMKNPNACIQDGGLVSCPNHPSTRSVTPIYRPVFK
jgi:hypothetical protein